MHASPAGDIPFHAPFQRRPAPVRARRLPAPLRLCRPIQRIASGGGGGRSLRGHEPPHPRLQLEGGRRNLPPRRRILPPRARPLDADAGGQCAPQPERAERGRQRALAGAASGGGHLPHAVRGQLDPGVGRAVRSGADRRTTPPDHRFRPDALRLGPARRAVSHAALRRPVHAAGARGHGWRRPLEPADLGVLPLRGECGARGRARARRAGAQHRSVGRDPQQLARPAMRVCAACGGRTAMPSSVAPRWKRPRCSTIQRQRAGGERGRGRGPLPSRLLVQAVRRTVRMLRVPRRAPSTAATAPSSIAAKA